MPGAIVPVDAETTAALVAEIKRVIGVVGGVALKQQRPWIGLTDEEAQWLYENCRTPSNLIEMVEAKLKEKNL